MIYIFLKFKKLIMIFELIHLINYLNNLLKDFLYKKCMN